MRTDRPRRARGRPHPRISATGRPAMRVPLTVNDFLYRAEAVSAYAAAVAAGEHFLRRASPKVMRVGLAGGAFPLLGCSVGCSGAARRSSRRAVALRTVLDRAQGG